MSTAAQPKRAETPQWQSTNGKLLIQRCDACGEPFYYPRVVCPFCLSGSVCWLECSGQGHIYSYSIVRRGVPYAIALVTLLEGPNMMTNIVDCPPDDIRIGRAVTVVFRDVDGAPTPMFQLAPEGDAT